MSTTRIYVVTREDGEELLIDAPNAAQAIRHVTHGMFSAKPATPKDVARLVGDGVEVETAMRDKGAEADAAAVRG